VIRKISYVGLCGGVVASLIAGAAPSSADGPEPVAYRVIELPGLSGSTSGRAFWINDAGIVVGSSSSTDGKSHAVEWDRHGNLTDLDPSGDSSAMMINDQGVVLGIKGGSPVLWDQDGTMTVLEPLGFGSMSAVAMNDRGTVVGQGPAADGSYHALRWDRQGQVTDLGTLPGGRASAAGDINNQDIVTGAAITTNGENHGVIWDPHDGIVELPAPTSYYSADGINDDDMIVGFTGETSPPFRSVPVRWDRNLQPELMDPPAGSFSSHAIKINNQGVSIGIAFYGFQTGIFHAVRWDRDGHNLDLGTLPGGPRSTALQINNQGTIIGNSYTADGRLRAVLWDDQGRINELSRLPGDDASDTSALNSSGTIVGVSRSFKYGHPRAVIWTPARPDA
jgi:probable HAF family extracellular repeat protein